MRHAEAGVRGPDAVLVSQPIEVTEMAFHGGLGEAYRLRVGFGDEDVAQHADRSAAGEFGLRVCRAAAFAQRLAERIDILLGELVGPRLVKCIPRSPAQAAPVTLEDPYQKAGCGCCNGRSTIGTFEYE